MVGAFTFSIESNLCRLTTELLAQRIVGERIPDSSELRDLLMYLEHYLVKLLREVHAEWKYESFDGLLPALVRKVGDRELEVFALAILITDQTLAPLHVRMQLAENGDEVQWLECRLEELDEKGNVVRTSYESPGRIQKKLLRFAESGAFAERNWRYHFELGERDTRA